MTSRRLAGITILCAGLYWYANSSHCQPPPVPKEPLPTKPDEKRKPLIPRKDVGKIELGGPIAPDGKTEVQCDLPVDQRIQNIGSKIDKAGMCVTSSIEMAARWANLREMEGLRDWCAQFPGGASPGKIDKQIPQFCKAKGIIMPSYIQYEGPDESLMAKALDSGRIVCVTYSGKDGVRYQSSISHMVCCVHYDGKIACLMDNNDDLSKLLWMTKDEFLKRWRDRGTSGWVFVWLAPGPPPVPRN